ncbi:leucyl aminopeptidase [Paenibacillus oceani]|uniref:Probable cytosol aminopeptidase n=1 Tax=Paenibacillus oceani TaxID=2772510 RepID=A0A927H2P9_9BACL|nr:leucyl aminopeptidase [Paenibacillus oceani]MBD2864694.1 leucyl aminopeptidase [Paenibacillus oceani]
MKFTLTSTSAAKLTVYVVSKGNLPVKQLGGYELKEYAGDKGAVTWLYGRESESHKLLVGLGDETKIGLDQIRAAAGVAGRAVEKEQAASAAVDFSMLSGVIGGKISEAEAASAWVEGWLLGTYAFDKYKSKKKQSHTENVELLLTVSKELEEALRLGKIRAEGTKLARDLGNEPPNFLRPGDVVERVIERFKDTPVQVEVFMGEQLEEHQMNGLIAVGKGSKYPPALIEMRYCTDPSKPLIALVGKGITFDTGGISLKSGRNLSDMRIDMGGSAAVIGALDIIVSSQLQANVVVFVATAENMPDGASMLPGEVIRYANGLTVQVGNTDAEGRLVLADALIRACKHGAEQIVDIATLTGACVSALGNKMAGVWGTDDMAEVLQKLGLRSGERVWPMPLEDEYDDLLKSQYADLCNITGVAYAGAITAALFLQRFVEAGTKWAHIDMAGPMDAGSTSGYVVEGPTGYGARLLADFVAERSK